VTTKEEVDEIISVAEAAIREVMDELSRENAIA
jgi:L-2,4-diaminobutyrate transaminase